MSSSPVLSEVRATRYLILCVNFVDRCLSFCPLTLFIVPLSIIDLRILITPLVSSNSSYQIRINREPDKREIWICLFRKIIYTVKPVHAVTSIKQSPVLKGHHFLVLSQKISYELNLF